MAPRSQLRLVDAAELLGWSVTHLRRLVSGGQLRQGDSEETVLWQDVRRLAARSHRLPSLATEAQLEADEPPTWLTDPAAVASLEKLEANRVIQGNCLDVMRTMPAAAVQTVVTSPPYWGVRRYPGEQLTTWADGSTVAFGQERFPEEYVRHTLEILHHLRRVVKEDGVVWWNVGDTYNTRSHVRAGSGERLDALEGRRAKESWKDYPTKRYSAGHPHLRDKDLTLVPFQIALAAQRIGWWLRSVVIWSKTNTVPESVKDRPTVTHEYILMLTQARFYRGSDKGSWAMRG